MGKMKSYASHSEDLKELKDKVKALVEKHDIPSEVIEAWQAGFKELNFDEAAVLNATISFIDKYVEEEVLSKHL